jgi:hypothetical protein
MLQLLLSLLDGRPMSIRDLTVLDARNWAIVLAALAVLRSGPANAQPPLGVILPAWTPIEVVNPKLFFPDATRSVGRGART